jgi:hypothetical protein
MSESKPGISRSSTTTMQPKKPNICIRKKNSCASKKSSRIWRTNGWTLKPEMTKPRMNDFKTTAMVSNYIALRPSQYALCHLKSFEYLELWYLTQEGCTDAAQHQHTQNNDTFGLTKVDDIVALRQVSVLRDSKNVMPNANLSF